MRPRHVPRGVRSRYTTPDAANPDRIAARTLAACPAGPLTPRTVGSILNTRKYWARKARAVLVERRELHRDVWLRMFKQLVKDVREHGKAIADPREPGFAELDPREPLVWAYVTLLSMPRADRQAYADLKENDSGRGLTDGQTGIREADYAFRELDTARSCRLEWLGRLVRTLDADLAGFHLGPVEGQVWTPGTWVVPGYPCSVVPIDRSHRVEDGKPFERRGLPSHAVIPTSIGDIEVRLHLHSAVDARTRSQGVPMRQLKAGAALFPKLTVDLEFTGSGFLVAGLQGPDAARTMRGHVASAKGDGCELLLWPELCVTPDDVERLVQHLEDTAVTDPGRPSLLVPGSWHVVDKQGLYRNRLVAIDGFGETVVDRYDKRNVFRLGDRPEAIEPGRAVSILVMEDRLVAFGICLDFCEDGPPPLYEHLDVDLIVVPSMGFRSTMASHLRHMPQQHTVHAAQVLVVTGSTAPGEEPLGYAVLSPVIPGREDPSKHRQDKSFATP